MRYDPNRRSILFEEDFFEAVAEVKTYVSSFTEAWIEEKGTVPDVDDFIELNPIWDRWMLYDAIGQEIERVAKLVQKELTT